MIKDVIIIGGGPAGISAALYTGRASLDTLIVCKGYGALGKAERVDNFYGHMEVSGQDLVSAGWEQARQLGMEILQEEVVGLEMDESCKYFKVRTDEKVYNASVVILTSGALRHMPKIPGLAALDGLGVSHCAVCDAFFHRGKDVAVLGNGAYAASEAQVLLDVAGSVTLLTNGEEPLTDFPEDVVIRREKIKNVDGDSSLRGVTFENGESLDISGLFVASGVAGAVDLARKVGAAVGDTGEILVDDCMRTSVPGLWAAGDCTGGMKQIAKAVYEGAVAGTDVIKYVRKLRKGGSKHEYKSV